MFGMGTADSTVYNRPKRVCAHGAYALFGCVMVISERVCVCVGGGCTRHRTTEELQSIKKNQPRTVSGFIVHENDVWCTLATGNP